MVREAVAAAAPYPTTSHVREDLGLAAAALVIFPVAAGEDIQVAVVAEQIVIHQGAVVVVGVMS